MTRCSWHLAHRVLDSSFPLEAGNDGLELSYSIPPGGTFVLQTAGTSGEPRVGWLQVTPLSGRSPVGARIFSFAPGGILVTESGIPSAAPTIRARIYVDKSGGHDTGLTLAIPARSVAVSSCGGESAAARSNRIPARTATVRFALLQDFCHGLLRLRSMFSY
jgi:hypothetical protein